MGIAACGRLWPFAGSSSFAPSPIEGSGTAGRRCGPGAAWLLAARGHHVRLDFLRSRLPGEMEQWSALWQTLEGVADLECPNKDV